MRFEVERRLKLSTCYEIYLEDAYTAMLTELKLPIFFIGFEDPADVDAKDDIVEPLEPLLSVLLRLLSLDWLMMAS